MTYGFCTTSKGTTPRVDTAGLAEFERQIRARFEGASTAKPATRQAAGTNARGLRRRYAECCARSTWPRRVAASAALYHSWLTAQDATPLATCSSHAASRKTEMAWASGGRNRRENPHGVTEPRLSSPGFTAI